MGRKKAAVVKAPAKVEVAQSLKEPVTALGHLVERVDELEGDLARIAKLLGSQFGGDFADTLEAIVSRKQGKA